MSLYGSSFSDAMKKAMSVERPAEGWPDRPKRTYKKKSPTKKRASD